MRSRGRRTGREATHTPSISYRSAQTAGTLVDHSFALGTTQADKDKDGFLNRDELALTLRNPKFVDTSLESMDTIDKDGKISLAEWLGARTRATAAQDGGQTPAATHACLACTTWTWTHDMPRKPTDGARLC